MHFPAVTNRRNETMKVRKQLRNENKRIQAYVKFPAILMVKKPGETTYSVHSEYEVKTAIYLKFFFKVFMSGSQESDTSS